MDCCEMWGGRHRRDDDKQGSEFVAHLSSPEEPFAEHNEANLAHRDMRGLLILQRNASQPHSVCSLRSQGLQRYPCHLTSSLKLLLSLTFPLLLIWTSTLLLNSADITTLVSVTSSISSYLLHQSFSFPGSLFRRIITRSVRHRSKCSQEHSRYFCSVYCSIFMLYVLMKRCNTNTKTSSEHKEQHVSQTCQTHNAIKFRLRTSSGITVRSEEAPYGAKSENERLV